MNDNDMTWLIQQIIGTSELIGQQMTPVAAAMMAEDLESYPREVLARALSRVRTEHTGRLTPKAIIDRIDEAMGRPAANEAWSVALTALDERNTVVWTDEISQAWGVAQSIANEGDMVGARMAFIAAYERLVRTAREERRIPMVSVSVGWDKELRAKAVEQAVKLGYMPAEQAAEFLPLPAPAFNPLALLEGGNTAVPIGIKDRVEKLKAHINEANLKDLEAEVQRKKDESDAWMERKAKAQQMTDEAMKKAA